MWWEVTVEGGEIGFGVLFKRMVKRPKTSMDETPRPELEAEEAAEPYPHLTQSRLMNLNPVSKKTMESVCQIL